MDTLYGLHAVEAALTTGSRKLDHVLIARERRDARLQHLIELCRSAGVRIRYEPKEQLTRLVHNEGHQGVVAIARERNFLDLEDILSTESEHPFLLALDGVEDPHNLGALLRTADGAGIEGVIIPERRSAPVNATVVKSSAGASEHIRIARVVNLVRALEELKKRNVWVVGLDERSEVDYDQFDFRTGCVLVLGSEGSGLHDLVVKTCDHLLRIPMLGGVPSLNVSVAGAVVMYEAARQRRGPTVKAEVKKAKKKPKGLGSL